MFKMNILDIVQPVAAIIRFRDIKVYPDLPRPGKYFQVTIDRAQISPSKKFIRFDQAIQPNSELHGWQAIDDLEIVEILTEPAETKGITLEKAA